VDLLGTLFGVFRRAPSYRCGVRTLHTLVREQRPDLIINCFEPLTGLYALTCRRRPPVVAVAHQFMFGHPDYVHATGARMQQLVMKWFIRVVGGGSFRPVGSGSSRAVGSGSFRPVGSGSSRAAGGGSSRAAGGGSSRAAGGGSFRAAGGGSFPPVGSGSFRLALSLYEARDLPAQNLTVCPPLLRRQLFELRPNPNGTFVLVYLLNHGYASQIIEWHQRNPKTVLHCFYDKPGAPAEHRQDETLTFHRLDGEKFLRMMADCKFVACTAGFESLSEAAYLGKPLFLVPVENHVEQEINALDAVRAGIAIADRKFNLDRLAELPDRLDTAKFHAWLNRAESLLLGALDRAARGGPAGAPPPRPA
jgi:hypothetical protein